MDDLFGRSTVSLSLFQELKRYVGFSTEDARALQAFHPLLRPRFQGILEDFYRRILEHEGTRRILKEPAQVERLKLTLLAWLDEVFLGPHDAAYYERRTRIGQTHLQVQLPQAYVFAAMAHIRCHLTFGMQEAAQGDPGLLKGGLVALAKILDLELALISGSYHETEKLKALAEQAGLARLGEMAAIVAHEVKNPLAGIGGAIQVIGSRLPSGSPDRAMIQEILERIDALNGTVRDLLLYARPRAPRPTPMHILPMLQNTALLLAQDPALGRTEVQVSGADLTIPADAELMKPLFLNLLINAAQAMDGKGRIQVTVAAEDGRCRISVADSGPGIPQEIRERVFEPFFSTKHRGTGLGLPIARRVVEAHGGRIAVACPPSGGTTVTVYFPLQSGSTPPP